jgi:monofunctional biosynthetic peptidoglycan transglycosylase
LLGWVVKAILIFFLGSLLWVLALRFINPPITFTMIGDIVGGHGVTKRWMSLDRIDPSMARAAIAAEDGRFCEHNGFDYKAIAAAAARNATGRKRIRGGSTISQQTAKNVFLWQGGGYPRKAAEAYFTFLIEKLWGKRRIMEVYLNVAETGIGTYGANAGSMRYFDHDASAMSPLEAARIAAILPLPKKRGAIAPKGFTRRYGNTISARIGQVRRDGLDACVYSGATAPKDKAPPPSKTPRELPGEEYETATPPPPEPSVDSPDINAVIPVEQTPPAVPLTDEPDTLTPPVEEPLPPPEDPEPPQAPPAQ